MTLEILDASGKTIRRYSSTDKPPFTMATLGETLSVPTYWVRPPAILSAAPGMHRFVWDLHETRPESSGYGYPISAIFHDTPREPTGPSVVPERYTVRLIAGGQTLSAPLTVVMDPRVTTPAAGLRQQHEIEAHLVTLINQNFDAQAEVRGLDHQLEALAKTSSAPLPGLWRRFVRRLLLSPEAMRKRAMRLQWNLPSRMWQAIWVVCTARWETRIARQPRLKPPPSQSRRKRTRRSWRGGTRLNQPTFPRSIAIWPAQELK